MTDLYKYARLPLYSLVTHLLRFCSVPAAYKSRITRKKHERKMEFEMFHDPIGAFRRKADYNYVYRKYE